jgi:integrase/recombinase XerD
MKYDLAILLESFFDDWLENQKKVSPNTSQAYKDSFRLLMRYAAKRLKKTQSAIALETLDADFIQDFLQELETSRGVCPRTRNLRMSAIKSFFRYVSLRMPNRNAQVARILAIEKSRTDHPQVKFLTEEELQALLKVQNTTTSTGQRDYTMILLAAETGMRISEMTSLKWENVYIKRRGGFIHCMGKGRKERLIPLSPWTAKALKIWQGYMKATSGYVFPGRDDDEMSRACFEKQLRKYVKLASESCQSLINKNITPHSLRHTAAMNFVLSDVDMFTIARILGHTSLKTTQIYIEEDPRLKEKALKKLAPKNIKLTKYKAEDKLMKFLRGY